MGRKRKRRSFDVFDGNACRSFNDDAVINASDEQENEFFQGSFESIHIKDCCDVKVTTSDTQVGVSLQAAIQVAIALVVNISIADGERAEAITKELLQRTETTQVNRQRIFLENSKDIEVRTRDTDVAVSLQVLIQILFTLLIQFDLF
jgi:spore coat protein X